MTSCATSPRVAVRCWKYYGDNKDGIFFIIFYDRPAPPGKVWIFDADGWQIGKYSDIFAMSRPAPRHLLEDIVQAYGFRPETLKILKVAKPA